MGAPYRECRYKPDSVCDPSGSTTTIYLGPALLQRAHAAYLGLAGGPPTPCLALLLVGFTEPFRSPGTLVVSYTTVSPLPVRGGSIRLLAGAIPRHRRSALCCTFRRVTPPGYYPAPCPAESGLSSTGFPTAVVLCTRQISVQAGPGYA